MLDEAELHLDVSAKMLIVFSNISLHSAAIELTAKTGNLRRLICWRRYRRPLGRRSPRADPRPRDADMHDAPPVAQHRGRNSELCCNLHQGSTAARQQCDGLSFEPGGEIPSRLQTPSNSRRNLAIVSTNVREDQSRF
jgi:hypothetical protein